MPAPHGERGGKPAIQQATRLPVGQRDQSEPDSQESPPAPARIAIPVGGGLTGKSCFIILTIPPEIRRIVGGVGLREIAHGGIDRLVQALRHLAVLELRWRGDAAVFALGADEMFPDSAGELAEGIAEGRSLIGEVALA